jgi:hypothetical protein
LYHGRRVYDAHTHHKADRGQSRHRVTSPLHPQQSAYKLDAKLKQEVGTLI